MRPKALSWKTTKRCRRVINRFILPLLAFIVLIGFLGVGLRLKPRELPSPFIDKPAPAFSLPQLLPPQREFSSARMKGSVWLLNVWASWCVACRTEHPLLNQIARANIVPIVGLNYKDNADDAAAWLGRLGNPYSHIPIDQSGDVGIEYGVYGVPETYLIDKAGIIRFKQIGPLTPDVLQRALLPLIEQMRKASP